MIKKFQPCEQSKKIIGPAPKYLIVNAFAVDTDHLPIVSDHVNIRVYHPDDEANYTARRYDVIAFCQFIPTASHYVAYVKRGQEWYRCNDSVVVKAEPDFVASKTYLAIFKLRDPGAANSLLASTADRRKRRAGAELDVSHPYEA